MDTSEASVAVAVGVIVAVTLLSGPLAGAVDLTPATSEGICTDSTNASVDVTVESLPDSATLSEGRYGSQTYYLRVPDAVATVQNITGCPFLVYEFDIEEMSYGVSTTAFLSPDRTGRQTLEIERIPREASEITREQYNATTRLLIRTDAGDTVVREESFVIEVEE